MQEAAADFAVGFDAHPGEPGAVQVHCHVIDGHAGTGRRIDQEGSPVVGGEINRLLDPAVDRFKDLDEDIQIDWRAALTRFVRLYAFLSQIVTYGDIELERLYVYAKALLAKLPHVGSGSLDLGSEIQLTHLRTEITGSGAFSLGQGGDPLIAVTGDGTGRKNDPTMEHLSTIVDILNQRFGTNLSETDKLLFDQFEEDWVADPDLGEQARSNTLNNFGYPFDKKFQSTIISRMDLNDEIFRQIMDDEPIADAVRNYYRERVYKRLQAES